MRACLDARVLVLETLDELGVLGLIHAVLFEQEFHIVKGGGKQRVFYRAAACLREFRGLAGLPADASATACRIGYAFLQ
jgi:hypothetical protein